MKILAKEHQLIYAIWNGLDGVDGPLIEKRRQIKDFRYKGNRKTGYMLYRAHNYEEVAFCETKKQMFDIAKKL